MNRDLSVVFEIESKYCTSDSFVDYNGYSISSKGFLPTVVNIMFIWVKFTHFSSLIPKMLTLTLAISCLTTFNLPWFMNLAFQVPMQFCSLQHWALLLSPVSHNWVLFLLRLCLFILSGVVYPLISSSILGNYQPREFIFQCPIFFKCIKILNHYVVYLKP